MTAMVDDVLKESRPDPQFTRQVVEEAMKGLPRVPDFD